MSTTNVGFNLNHTDICLYVGAYSSDYFGTGYMHKWSDWYKLGALQPNTNITNVCADGVYKANAGEKLPIFTYFVRHHVLTNIQPDTGSYPNRTELGTTGTANGAISTSKWQYSPSEFLIPTNSRTLIEYISDTTFEQQSAYFEKLTGKDLGSGNQSNQAFVMNIDWSREHFNTIYSQSYAASRYLEFTPTDNKFEGTEEYLNDVPDYNPLKLQSCEPIFSRDTIIRPFNNDTTKMAYYLIDGSNANVLGCFGGVTSSNLPHKYKILNGDQLKEEISKSYTASGVYSYYLDDNDIKALTGVLNDYVIRVGNFAIGDRIQYLSDYGITEILIGAELK